MNRVKDVVIVVLLLAIVYLLATRDGSVSVSDELHTSAATVAVLPYVNMSGDPSTEYLSDSLWNGTINSLVKHPELKVASRTTSAVFKGTHEDIRTIGGDLGVSFVVEGAVRKSDARIRMTAQLIRVDDGTHVWSKSYDRDADSADDIPVLIADSVASQIENSL
jgi:adenylate cyclase